MKRTCKIGPTLVVSILLLSLFLQSCGDFSHPFTTPEKGPRRRGLTYPSTKTRKGLDLALPFQAALLNQLPSGCELGKAYSEGDCFFDALAQWVNEINDTDVNTDKYFRMLCHEFYQDNKRLVADWDLKDNREQAASEDRYAKHEYYYAKIQYTADECDNLFNKDICIWGRPWVEGIILCRKLELKGICCIEVFQDPETGEPVVSYHVVDQEGYKSSISEEIGQALVKEGNIPVLVNVEGKLHFVPLWIKGKTLRRQAGLEEEKDVIVSEDVRSKGKEKQKGEEKEEISRELKNGLPRISFNYRALSDVLNEILVKLPEKEAATLNEETILYLKNIQEEVDTIKRCQSKEHTEYFLYPMKDAILGIRNTARFLYELTEPYHNTLPNVLETSILQSIASFERQLNKLEMPVEEKEDLILKTKRLYAEQSYICRQDNLQRRLMDHLGTISHLLTKPGKPSPRCYISYAWPSKENKEREYWVQPFLSILYDHLTAAGTRMIMDIRDNKPGDSIYQFMNRYHDGNPIILIGTESLLEKHNSIIPHAIKTELSIINNRFEKDQKAYGYSRVYPLLLSGTIETSFPEIYDKYRTVRDAREMGYVLMLQRLIDWLYKRQIIVVKTDYENLWSAFDANCRGLARGADIQEIEQELNEDYHRRRLDDLKQNSQFKDIQAQKEDSTEIDEPGYATVVLEGLHENNLNKRYYKKGDEDQKREKRKEKIADQLREWYTSEEKKCISLLIPKEKGPTRQIPIEKLYTRLAIIGETEKKEKRKETEESKPGEDVITYGIISTHESIFEPKEAIELEKLFEHKQLKTVAEKRVLLQGSAGIGKTTLCQHIAYRWAQKELFQEFDHLFWLPLRNLNKLNKGRYSEQPCLADYLAQECQLDRQLVQSFLNDPSLRKKCLILLDGYDELSSDAEHSDGSLYPIFKELKAFPHLLITTRPQLVDVKTGCQLEKRGSRIY